MPAQPEDTAPAKAGGRPLGELEDATPVVLRVIKIETPEASVSGVFNFRHSLEPFTVSPPPPCNTSDAPWHAGIAHTLGFLRAGIATVDRGFMPALPSPQEATAHWQLITASVANLRRR